MTKLCQIIAVANGKKSKAQSELTRVHHTLAKSDLLQGIARTYRPKDEEGEKLPGESKRVQFTAAQGIREAAAVLAELIDVVATQDMANCTAKADVSIDGKVVLPQVPVTHLLFLEKQLTDLHTFVDKLPTLDPAETWASNGSADSYETPPFETARTKKIPRNHVKAEATDKHPAQVEVYTEDVVVGYWSTKKFSGAIPSGERTAMLERVRKLQDAVKFAREEANSVEVKDAKFGKPIMEYIFGNSAV
jgi:hypothetical protein